MCTAGTRKPRSCDSLRRTPRMRASRSPFCVLVDQRHEAIADFEAEQIHRLHVFPRQLARFGGGGGGDAVVARSASLPAAVAPLAERVRAAAGDALPCVRNAKFGMPGIRPITASRPAATASAFGWPKQLPAHLAAHVLRAGHARDDDGDRGRQQQRRNLRDQAVADGEQRVGAAGAGERHAVRDHADGEAADDVDEQDQDAGDGIAAHELAGAVHGAVEVRFRAHFGAARRGLRPA